MLVSLVGLNKYAKQREMRKIISTAAVTWIYGESGLSPWYEHLGQSNLFGESSIIIAERIIEDASKKDQEVLAEHFKTLNIGTMEQQVVFLIDDEKLLKKSKLGELLTEHKLIKFPQPTAAQIGIWVQQEADRLGVKIDKQLVPKLIEKLGVDQYAIQTELERWALHSPAQITLADISSISPLTEDIDTFGLTTAWEQKNTSRALDALGSLRRQGNADQMIIGMLGWKVESLLIKNSQKTHPKWTLQQLKQAMINLYRLDLGVKQGKIDPVIGLELWLVETMVQR